MLSVLRFVAVNFDMNTKFIDGTFLLERLSVTQLSDTYCKAKAEEDCGRGMRRGM
jgi:hypothetical protein